MASFYQFTKSDVGFNLGKSFIEGLIEGAADQCDDDAEAEYMKRMMYQIVKDEGADKTNGGHFYTIKMNNGMTVIAAYYHPTKRHTASIQLGDHIERCYANPKEWAVVWCYRIQSGCKTFWNSEV